jgi:hypothetical protein
MRGMPLGGIAINTVHCPKATTPPTLRHAMGDMKVVQRVLPVHTLIGMHLTSLGAWPADRLLA